MIDFKAINEARHMKQGFCPWSAPLKKIKGIRENCSSGKQNEVELRYERAFFLRDGVTGYESFLLDDGIDPNEKKLPRMIKHGWLACAGTPGRWDKLYIPPEEMKRVFEEEGLLQ